MSDTDPAIEMGRTCMRIGLVAFLERLVGTYNTQRLLPEGAMVVDGVIVAEPTGEQIRSRHGCVGGCR